MPARVICPKCGERQLLRPDPRGRPSRCERCRYPLEGAEVVAGEEPILAEPAEGEYYDDEQDLRRRPELPRKVMTAGIVWIVFGVLILIRVLLALIAPDAQA